MSRHNRERRRAKAFAKGQHARLWGKDNPYRKTVYRQAWIQGFRK